MKIALTGGSGFIGTNILLSSVSPNISFFPSDITEPRCKKLQLQKKVDLCDEESLNKWLNEIQPDILIHLGARTDLDGKTPAEYSANTTGVQNICNWLKNNPSCQTALFASTRLVCRIGYQPTSDSDYYPTTAYGESKIIGERIVRKANLPQTWTIFRPTSIWGPWMGAPYDAFFRYVSNGIYMHPKGRKITKSFGYVGNAVEQILALAFRGASQLNGKTIYLADYEQIDVLKWGNEIRSQLGKSALKEAPCWALKAAASIGDLAHRFGVKKFPLTSFRLDNILTNMPHDTHELQSVLSLLPHTHQEGIKKTIEWLNDANR
jgi:GlcNAc-P-P-Und epimerase